MSGKTNASNQDTELSELVSKHINNLDDKGKLQLPDDMPDWQKHVVRAEKRQRDAQSALSITQKEKRELEAKNQVLGEQVSKTFSVELELSPEEAQALEVLKYRDPDAYRLQMNDLEKTAAEKKAERLNELTQGAVTKVEEQFIAKDRITVLQEFREANPDTVLTDEVLVNDVPPRFMNDLNSGKYDYQTYLTKVAEYLKTGKVLPGQSAGEQHNLSNLPGSTTPGKQAAENAGKTDYAKVTF